MNATAEPEIIQPVLLCDDDGQTLRREARGWSRTPLHTANLRGGWGRTKRWDYWCILSESLAVAVTYADVDYLGLATVWWVDLETGATGGHDAAVPFSGGITLPDRPGTEPLRHRDRRSQIDIVDETVEGADGTTITATWTERDGRAARLEARIDLPEGHESLNVVIPWSDRRFQYTSKHQARPAHGRLTIGTDARTFGGDAGRAWGVLDVGRGRWPYRVRWNWGGGAGVSAQGSVIGLQLGGKWTVGTGFTENGIIVDGRLTKIGEELEWTYQWDAPLRPWRVHNPDGSLDLVLAPTYDRHTRINAVVLATEVHQVFGTWSGHVTGDSGARQNIENIVGFAEESRSRW